MDIIEKIDGQLIDENKWDKLKKMDELLKHFDSFMSSYPTSPNMKKIFNMLRSERNSFAQGELGMVGNLK
jgi:hypothetical protein